MHLTRLNEELLENLKNMQVKITYLNNQNNQINNNNVNVNYKNNNFDLNHNKEFMIQEKDKGFYPSNNDNSSNKNKIVNENLNYLNNHNYKGNLKANEFAEGEYNVRPYDRNVNDDYNYFVNNKNYNQSIVSGGFTNNNNNYGNLNKDARTNFMENNQRDVRLRSNGDNGSCSNRKNNYSMGNNELVYGNKAYLDNGSDIVIK